MSQPGRHEEWEAGGNFNYGATGAALGLTSETLLRAAGWAQSRNERGSESGDSRYYLGQPYGDERGDQAWIKQGMRYFFNGCRQQ